MRNGRRQASIKTASKIENQQQPRGEEEKRGKRLSRNCIKKWRKKGIIPTQEKSFSGASVQELSSAGPAESKGWRNDIERQMLKEEEGVLPGSKDSRGRSVDRMQCGPRGVRDTKSCRVRKKKTA